MLNLKHHPQRDMLEKELQQRFFPALTAPCRISHWMLTVAPASRNSEFVCLQQLAHQHGVALLEGDVDLNLELGDMRLRWERHSEFSTYSFIKSGAHAGFEDPHSFLPSLDWFNPLPGQLFRVSQLHVLCDAQAGAAAQLLQSEHCLSSLLLNGSARVWTDFRKHPEGAGRMVLLEQGLSAPALGRLVQQLFDLGNYRKLSLLGWPLSRQALSQLHQLEQQLSDITQRIEQQQGSDEQLLREISQLSAQTEHLIANNSARLEASQAYYQLTLDRLRALKEQPVDGMMTLQDFSERRLTPAYRTAQSVQSRQRSLSNRLGRSTELLRTRINLQLERQNTRLLESMNRRVKLQLSLQRAVERLSVVAISYYAVQLADKALSSLGYWWPLLPVSALKSLTLPAVLALTCWLLWRLQRQHPDPG